MHVLLRFSGPSIPLTAFGMFHFWEQNRWCRKSPLRSTTALKEKLLRRLENCPEAAKGPILFCLSAVLRHDDQVDLNLVARLFHMGWKLPFRPIRMEMLELIGRYGNDLVSDAKTATESIRETLEATLGDDPLSNTFIFEALNAIDALPCPVTREHARSELRQILATDLESEGHLSMYQDLVTSQLRDNEPAEQIRAALARNFISKFWEEIFQGVYFEIYETLGAEEKVRLMNLAAMHDDISFGDTFALEELIGFGHASSAKAFTFHADRIRIDHAMQQDAVAAWCLGVIGCARLRQPLPEWLGGNSIALDSWKLIGELLYMEFSGLQSAVEFQNTWLTLRSEAAMGAADALFLLHEAERGGLGVGVRRHKCCTRLLAHEVHVKHLMEHSLLHLEKLVSLSKWNRENERTAFILRILGGIGDQYSVAILRGFLDDPVFGADAVAAIEKINKT